MGRRIIEVFLTQDDENEFIRVWNTDKTCVINPIRRVGAAICPLLQAPEMPHDDRKLGQAPDRPDAFCVIDRTSSQKYKWRDCFDGNFEFIDQPSIIVVGRTHWDTNSSGSLGLDLDRVYLNMDQAVVLDDLWHKIVTWVKKNYFRIPYGGYVAPNALKLAVQGRNLIALIKVHSIRIREDGSYDVTSRRRTKDD